MYYSLFKYPSTYVYFETLRRHNYNDGKVLIIALVSRSNPFDIGVPQRYIPASNWLF